MADKPFFARCFSREYGLGVRHEVYPDQTVDLRGPRKPQIIIVQFEVYHEIEGHVIVTDVLEVADGKEVHFIPTGVPLTLGRCKTGEEEAYEGIYIWRHDVMPPC